MTTLKVPYGKKGGIPLNTYVTLKRWAEKARDRPLNNDGKSSVPSGGARTRDANKPALIGHGVHVDGVTPSRMTSKPTSQTE